MTPNSNHQPVMHSQTSNPNYSGEAPRPLHGGVAVAATVGATGEGMATVQSGEGGDSRVPSTAPANEAAARLALELKQFSAIASKLRGALVLGSNFEERCRQAFEIANDLFTNAPTWVCFYRELMGGNGILHQLFSDNKSFGAFLRTDQHHQIQLMLTALRSRDLPESDPNDPQRMITVRLPKSLHEAMCEEATRLNISVNRLCISRMLQLLDPEMIPETNSKPRGRKPRTRSKNGVPPASSSSPISAMRDEASSGFEFAGSTVRP